MLNFNNNFFLAFFILFSSTQVFCPGRKSHNFSRVKLGDLSFLNPRASVSNNSLGRTSNEVERAVEGARETLILIINGCSTSPEQKENLVRFVNSDLFAFFYQDIFSFVFLAKDFEELLQGWLCEKFGIYSYIDEKDFIGIRCPYSYRGMVIDYKPLLFSDGSCQKILMYKFFQAIKFHCLNQLSSEFKSDCQNCNLCFPFKLVLEMIDGSILPCLKEIDISKETSTAFICDLFKLKVAEQMLYLIKEKTTFFSLGIDCVGGLRWNTLLDCCLLTFLDNAEIEPFIPEKDRKLDWDQSFLDSPMVRILKSDIKFDI